jgi:hypothetical protein
MGEVHSATESSRLKKNTGGEVTGSHDDSTCRYVFLLAMWDNRIHPYNKTWRYYV